eukprot:1459938-Rhodomonas_salina.3
MATQLRAHWGLQKRVGVRVCINQQRELPLSIRLRPEKRTVQGYLKRTGLLMSELDHRLELDPVGCLIARAILSRDESRRDLVKAEQRSFYSTFPANFGERCPNI